MSPYKVITHRKRFDEILKPAYFLYDVWVEGARKYLLQKEGFCQVCENT